MDQLGALMDKKINNCVIELMQKREGVQKVP